ncbi:unnamed protein product [Phaeothamnion confervicola]
MLSFHFFDPNRPVSPTATSLAAVRHQYPPRAPTSNGAPDCDQRGPGGVLTTFIEENGGGNITDTVYAGKISFSPQGLTHFELKIGCTPALLISAFRDDDFSVQQTSTTALAGLPKGWRRPSASPSPNLLPSLPASTSIPPRAPRNAASAAASLKTCLRMARCTHVHVDERQRGSRLRGRKGGRV